MNERVPVGKKQTINGKIYGAGATPKVRVLKPVHSQASVPPKKKEVINEL